MTFEICPCGIAQVDCDYHRPTDRRAVVTFLVEEGDVFYTYCYDSRAGS